MDSLEYTSLKRTVYGYSSTQKGCIVRYLHVVDVVVTFMWDEHLFIFWYEEYVVLSVPRRVSERCSCMNEDNFFQLLLVYCVWNYIVRRTVHCAALHDSGTLYRALIIVQTGHFPSLLSVKRMATRRHDPWKQVLSCLAVNCAAGSPGFRSGIGFDHTGVSWSGLLRCVCTLPAQSCSVCSVNNAAQTPEIVEINLLAFTSVFAAS